MSFKDGRAQCDMRAECTETVTHIGAKGYAYCATHAPERRGFESVRKMRAWERRWIGEGRALPSYAPGPEPKPPVTVYAAVIEWPSALEPADPALILATTEAERSAEIIAEIRETADLLTGSDWRDALAGVDSAEWSEYTDALDTTGYGAPFVSTYEREIRA